MADILQEICEAKRAHVIQAKQRMPLSKLEESCCNLPTPRGFAKALKSKVSNGKIGLIAEIKKASPSRGVIRTDFHPESIAQAYANAGATCLSVLTDAPYFQGEDAYITRVRNTVSLPVLRKDFMVDPYQIYEARAIEADAILIIMAALSDNQAREIEDSATSLGLDALIEVHDEAELERALTHLRSSLIGINNRNLKTLAIDLATSERLRTLIPADKTVVCESGLRTHADITRMQRRDMHCFLVGESLMAQDDIEAATRTLLTGV